MTQFIKRHSLQAQAITLLDAIVTAEGLSVGTTTTMQRVLKRIGQLAVPNPILLYGKRVEAMFAFIAASLGKCLMIREEDVGDIYATTAVQPPDYRIVLLDGTELLIEVKNCHHLKKPLRLKSDYVARLENYGRVLNRPVKLAIYWSRWCVWTMVPLEALRVAGAGSTLSFPDAMMTNEMAVLGDHMIGTTPPLAVRFLADPTKPRKATPRQERVAFTIGGVEFFCAGRRVEDKLEKAIVNHFMLFGKWPQTTNTEIQGGELLWIEFIAEPPEIDTVQRFRIVGEASSMIARHFDFRTVSMSWQIKRLHPLDDPSKFGISIPHDYEGRDVPLWRFVVHPGNGKESTSSEGLTSPPKTTTVEH